MIMFTDLTPQWTPSSIPHLQPIDAHNTCSILFASNVMQAEEKSHDSDPARVASFAKLSDRSPRGFSILLNAVIDLMVDHLDTSVESEL